MGADCGTSGGHWLFWITTDKKLWLKIARQVGAWELSRIKPSTSLKETFSVTRIKWRDLVSKSCLGQMWAPFLPKKDQRRLECSLIHGWFSRLQPCRVLLSPWQLFSSCSELACTESIRSTQPEAPSPSLWSCCAYRHCTSPVSYSLTPCTGAVGQGKCRCDWAALSSFGHIQSNSKEWRR